MKDLKKKIDDLHNREDVLNKEIGKIDKEVKGLLKRKDKLSKSVSKNMLYRNLLITKHEVDING